MADINEKFDDNAEGRFFVDRECIACDTCVGLAGGHFKLTGDCDHAYIYRQPTSEKEVAQCLKAMAACPVEAIGQIG